ncbi:uncharacterized protein LOC110853411 [Folsomia candida]|uniref:uncharacterized protein LOC110853411 n=1 Tax=Folsomia candida TaxID=158441 RepID=UPI000B8FC89E|nr:uncharacterized protein LOC110853411 [Folsomia candida]
MLSKSSFLGVFVAVGLAVVVAHPQLFALPDNYDEHSEQAQPQRVVQQADPASRYRRDSLPAADHVQEHHHGWPQKGWGWQKKGWGGWPSVGPVFTYVRTDGWSNFQWGVRHKVGGGKGWGKK